MLLSSARKIISQYHMLQASDSILVAVSGGPDSLALLHIMLELKAEYDLTLGVAHFNHQLRGAAALRDAQFVESLAARLNLSCRLGTANVEAYAEAQRLSLEEAGRVLRYRFLREAAGALGASRIALGHTRGDQAETVLWRLLRGTGTTGLCGIYPVLPMGQGLNAVRPLIHNTRSEVLDFLKARGIPYIEDWSNQDLRFDRNRIRSHLIPYLEREFNPHVSKALAQLARLAQEDEACLSQTASAEGDRILRRQGDHVLLPVAELMGLSVALQRRVLRKAIQLLKGDLRRIEYAHVEALRALCAENMSGKQVQLPYGLLARREFAQIIFSRRESSRTPAFSYNLLIPGSVSIPEAACHVKAERVDRFDPGLLRVPSDGQTSALLDAKAVGDLLVVRNRQPGDRCLSENGSRKLKEILIAQQVPRRLRDRLPLITRPSARPMTAETSAGGPSAEVLWVPGYLLAPPVAASAASDHCIRLTLIPSLDSVE